VLPYEADTTEQDAQQVVEEVLKEATAAVPGADGVRCEVRTPRGAAGAVLVRQADEAELLVVGTRACGPVSRTLLGSVAEHVLHHATCPVAVVPAGDGLGVEPPRVLVGVDHSPSALAALAWAADTAARRGAVLVPVIVRDPVWTGDAAASLTNLEASERRSLEDAVPAHDGLVVRPEVVSGPPGRTLVGMARPQDLLVLGTRGRSAVVSALLGSTSTYAVRHAHCPVVVLREG
jgi:nucleotide-binding universal stress UspA family protein